MRRLKLVTLAGVWCLLFTHGLFQVGSYFGDQPGYGWSTAPNLHFVFFNLIALLPALFLPIRNSPSTYLMWLVYFLHVVGSVISLPSVAGAGFRQYVFGFFSAVGYGLGAVLAARVKTLAAPDVSVAYGAPASVFLIAILAVCLFLASYQLPEAIPSVFDVYGMRASFKEQLLATNGVIAAYLPVWMGYVLTPISIYLFFHYAVGHKWLAGGVWLAIATITATLIYAVSGLKSVVFISLLTAPLLYALRKKDDPLCALLALLCASYVVLFLLSAVTSVDDFYYHWGRRALILPGVMTSIYFEVYSSTGFDGVQNVPEFISKLVFEVGGSANSGLIGSGVSRGVVGIIFNYAIFFTYCGVINRCARGLPANVTVALLFPAAYAFSNSNAPTVLVTYGGFLVAVFLYVWGQYLNRLSLAGPIRRDA